MLLCRCLSVRIGLGQESLLLGSPNAVRGETGFELRPRLRWEGSALQPEVPFGALGVLRGGWTLE